MKTFSGRYIATLGLLSASLYGYHISEQREPDYLAKPLNTIPPHVASWAKVADREFTASILKRLMPTDYLSRTYRKGSSELDLLITFYAQQRAGESMHSPKNCLPGSGWEIWKYESAFVTVGDKRVPINKYYIQNAGERLVVLYWYQSQNRIIASEYLGKIMLVRDTFADGKTAGSLVRLTVPDRPGATEEALEFASAIIPEVQSCFRKR